MKSRPSHQHYSSIESLESRIAPATFTVTTLADAGPGSLRQAVTSANAAASDDTIVFAADLAGTITIAPNNPIAITDDVFIKGHSGIKLSGNDASQILYITDDTTAEIDVSVSKLIFTRGHGDGPGIGNDGGAIYSLENLTVKQSTFRDNHIPGAMDWGGAIAATNSDAILKIARCVFEQNSTGGRGGAVYANGIQVEIVSSVFEGNSANEDGGALRVIGSERVLIKSCSLTGNTTSTGVGGGIAFTSVSNAVVQNTLVADNTTTGAAKNGGGIAVSSTFLSLTDSTIRDNAATGDGGGLHADATSSVVVDYSLFLRNHANVYGGGVAFIGNLSVLDSRFTRNSADDSGGGIRGDVASTGDFFMTNSIIGRNDSGDNGGGLNLFNSGTQVIDSCSIINNISANAGGGIRTANGDLTLIDTLISGNSAVTGGGASVAHTTRFVNSLVTDNTASTSGGGIVNTGGTAVLLQNTPVTGNTAPASPDLQGSFSAI
jgi:predicted outer membrane repeat protein